MKNWNNNKNTFKKEERLTSRKAVLEIIKKGKVIKAFPFYVRYRIINVEQSFPVQVIINVPKKRFKKAVDRNRIKRLIRESYRKNKATLYDCLIVKQINIQLFINFVDNNMPDYELVNTKVIGMIEKLCDKITANNE